MRASLEWNRAYQPRDVDCGTAVFSAAFYAASAPDELIANCRSVLEPIDVEIILYDQVRRLFGDRKDREACPQKGRWGSGLYALAPG
ncbi:hypothetical protein [Mesorhizobium sp. BHbdii]